MDVRYRIVFKGQIHDGYDLALVKKLVAFRLNASATQIERLFTGRKVIVKADLNERIANRYVGELSKLGMVAWAEPERKKASSTSPKQAPQAPVPTATTEFDPQITCVNAQQLRNQIGAESTEECTTTKHLDFDPQKTTLNIGAAEALLNQMGLSLSSNQHVVEIASLPAVRQENQRRPSSTKPAPQAMPPAAPIEPVAASVAASPVARPLPVAPSVTDEHVCCPHCGTDISELMVERDCQPAPALHVFPLAAPGSDEETSTTAQHTTPLQNAWRWLRARGSTSSKLN